MTDLSVDARLIADPPIRQADINGGVVAPARVAQLQASVFCDVTSVMDLGIMLGALRAAGLAGSVLGTRLRPLFGVSIERSAA